MSTPYEAQSFFERGVKQLDHLLIGEPEAKIAMLTTMVSGGKGILVGPPGGAKTTLASDAYRLIDGIDPEHMAILPPQSDLQPQQLIGGEIVTSKKITDSRGDSHTEDSAVGIDSLILPSTKVIFANEINRINPYALNAALEAYEKGTIDTTAGRIVLDGLEYIISTMNPSEHRSGTFPITVAMASRHNIGAILGTQTNDRDMVQRILKGWVPQPEKVEPITDLKGLHELRAASKEIAIPGNVMDYAVDTVIKTGDALRTNKTSINEAVGRLARQIGETAKTLALFEAQDTVQIPQIDLAAKFTIAARIGALSTDASQQIEQVTAKVRG